MADGKLMSDHASGDVPMSRGGGAGDGAGHPAADRGEGGRPANAVVGLFSGPDALLGAVARIRPKGLGRVEAYTPYPVHGLDTALGYRRSPLGGMVLVMGIVGVIAALVLQGWTSAVDYRLITSGKVPFSWQAFVPVLFELMVLFATFTAGLGAILLLGRLPRYRHPILGSRAISSITRDRLALAIEREDGRLDLEAAREALADSGASEIEVVLEPEPLGTVSSRFIVRGAVAVAVSCAVAGFATYWGTKLFAALPPMIHMQEQPRLEPYGRSASFAGGSSMRLPAAGTVARGHIPYPFQTQEEAAVLANPLPVTKEVLARGRKVYRDVCVVCHGVLGNGDHALGAAYGAQPANLLGASFGRDQYPDGKLYHAIVKGKNSMPAYAADVRGDDRWAVVHYVRALQRAQAATDADLEEALRGKR